MEIRRSYDRLISTMGFPILVRCHLYIESGPRAHFLSLARSKLRLCLANHRAGYFCNLPCDWPSIIWAYSEQEIENGYRLYFGHDDAMTWKRFPHYWTFVKGIHRPSVDSPHKGPVMWRFDVLSQNKLLNKQCRLCGPHDAHVTSINDESFILRSLNKNNRNTSNLIL